MALRVGDLVRFLLPYGTGISSGRAKTGHDWQTCPIWPADVFAVAASLAERSGCYAETGIAFSRNDRERQRKLLWSRNTRRLGMRWAKEPSLHWVIKLLWQDICKAFLRPVCGNKPSDIRWKLAALRLLAISDEAASGFGWTPETSLGDAKNFLFKEILSTYTGRKSKLQLPYSIAWLVPSYVACVQPKANTPDVGCTVRSLSHNLALLPSRGVVETTWSISVSPPVAYSQQEADKEKMKPLNILIVPFPFYVGGKDFVVTRSPADGVDGYFKVNQNWLHHAGKALSGVQIGDFILDLINESKVEFQEINAVVFPEGALTPPLAVAVARYIAKKDKRIELFICGTSDFSGGGGGLNQASIVRLEGGKVVDNFIQGKHHKWKLDENQIKNYNIGHVLHPKASYWEDIVLSKRRLMFGVNRGGNVISALVCEDLARADPVMPVLSAIGPNLVVALLMDGPQLVQRWPGRYATVLADDPGSAVLTVTSLGMVLRSSVPGVPLPGVGGRRCIALWREPKGEARELDLPHGSHGLVVALTAHNVNQKTLDLRADRDVTTRFILSAVRSVKAASEPVWLTRV